RSAVKQDLLYTLGSVLTVFAPSKNNAVSRLEHLLQYGTDPGAVEALPILPESSPRVRIPTVRSTRPS
ncbi:restriction endonuclease, partial [Gordonia sp. ABSL1-1]|nr:restriction endonuclease [Gordonia sp. ABSL1-1]